MNVLCCAVVAALLSSSAFAAPTSFAIRVDAPAFVGMPIWIRADLTGPLVVRYPYGNDPHYFGSNQLELKREGQPLTPIVGQFPGGLMGVVAGSAAPPGSPQGRLPLHLGFAIDKPGRYSVRWTVQGTRFTRGPSPSTYEETLAQSDWLDFEIRVASPRDREAWLRSLLASPPAATAAYVGDYLPSLLAGRSDPRVVRALIDATHAPTEFVASSARGGLGTVPAEVAVPATMDGLRQRGPSSELAYYLSWHAPWFRDRRDEFLGIAAQSLKSPDDGVVVGALQMIGFAGHFDLPRTAPAARDAHAAVAAAAPALMARGPQVVHALAVTLGGMKDPVARASLWQLVERRPEAREQALIALTWIRDAQDLQPIADLLMKPGNSDPRGSNLAGLAYHLIDAYGESAFPFVERALADSPYAFVKMESAEQLALKGRASGFRFVLDTVQSKPFYRPELEGWFRRQFHVPPGDEAALVAFLNARIADPQPPPPREDPINAAVLQLKSADAATRKAAAQSLIDAPQSVMNRVNIPAEIINEIIHTDAGAVSPETWRDAALVLARVHANAAGPLLVYMERDGATAALIELGEPAVPDVTDVLTIGGPVRRRLAAEVLGAIGGTAARAALSAASKSETDSNVRKAIQAALRQR